MIEGYLLEREPLVMVFVLVDAEIGPDAARRDDARLAARERRAPHRRGHQDRQGAVRARPKRRRDLAEGCHLESGDIVWVSAAKGVNIDQLRDLVVGHLRTADRAGRPAVPSSRSVRAQRAGRHDRSVIEHFDAAWRELTADGAPFAMTEIEVRGDPDARVRRRRRRCDRSGSWRRMHGDTHLHRVRGRAVHLRRDRRAGARARRAVLRDVHGVGPGDRVAIAMRNYPEWVVAYWAIVVDRRRGRGHERVVDDPGDGVRRSRDSRP